MSKNRNYRLNKRQHDPNSTPVRPMKQLREQVEAQDKAMATIANLAATSDPDWKSACLQILELAKSQQQILNAMLKMLETDTGVDEEKEEPSAEEKERKRSLVVFGLPESKKEKRSDRIKEDYQAVEDLLDEVGTDCVPTSVYRLPGRTDDPTRPRLLKIVLSTSYQQRDVLKNARNLRDSQRFKRTIIRASMTKEERQLDYDLRQAAKKLREKGNQFVIIRNFQLYVNRVLFDHVSLKPKNQ